MEIRERGETCQDTHTGIRSSAWGTEEESAPQHPPSFPTFCIHGPWKVKKRGQAFMLSLPSHLSVSSLLPGFSVVFMTGTVKTTQVVLERVEEAESRGMERKNYQCPHMRIYTHMPQNRYMNNEMDRWMGSRRMWLDGRMK